MSGNVIAVSEAVSLGLHGMCLLASAKRRLNARDMAQALGVSEAHLTKVFQKLVRTGLVRSFRGIGGGFELAARPSEISLLAVYQAIEELPQKRLSFCATCPRCPFARCIFDTVVADSTERFFAHLSATTLEKVSLKPELKKLPPFPDELERRSELS